MQKTPRILGKPGSSASWVYARVRENNAEGEVWSELEPPRVVMYVF